MIPMLFAWKDQTFENCTTFYSHSTIRKSPFVRLLDLRQNTHTFMVVFFSALHIATAALVLASYYSLPEFYFEKKTTSRKKYTFQFNGIFQITYVLTPLARRHTEHQTTKYNNSTKSSRKKPLKGNHSRKYEQILSNLYWECMIVFVNLRRKSSKITQHTRALTFTPLISKLIRITLKYFFLVDIKLHSNLFARIVWLQSNIIANND